MAESKLNPLRLSPADAARLLSKAGGEAISEDEIRRLIDAGAPVDGAGSINLVHLGAWMLRGIGDTRRS